MEQKELPCGQIVELPDTYDPSALSDIRNCARFYYLRHIRGITAEGVSLAAHFGQCFHEMLRSYYMMHAQEWSPENLMLTLTTLAKDEWSDATRYDEVRESFHRIATSQDPPHKLYMTAFDWNWEGEDGDSLRNRPRAEQLIKIYRNNYPTEPFKVVEPRDSFLEVGFLYEITPEVYLYGRIDLLGEWEGYGVVPVDHKTSRDLGKNKFMEFSPWFQGDTYIVAAKHYFPDVHTVCANVIQNAVTKSNVQRFLNTRTPEELAAWRDDALQLIEELHWRWDKWLWPRDTGSHGGACTKWGGCQFRPLCITPEYSSLQEADKRPVPGGWVYQPWRPWEEDSRKEIITR